MLFEPLQVVALETKVCWLSRLCLCDSQAWEGSKLLWLLEQTAAVARLLPCCWTGYYIWQLSGFDTEESQRRVSLLMPLAHQLALKLGICFHPCCAVKELCTCQSVAVLRPLSAAVNANPERCAGWLTVLRRTATAVVPCAWQWCFSEQGYTCWPGLSACTVNLLTLVTIYDINCSSKYLIQNE